MSIELVPFETLYAIPSKNGLTRPARVRGEGFKMINMGYSSVSLWFKRTIPARVQIIPIIRIHRVSSVKCVDCEDSIFSVRD